MKKALIFASSLTLMAALTACQEKSDTTAAVPSGNTKSGDMADMPAAGAMQHGVAVGTVTAIDWDGKVGRITRISAQNPAVE